MKLSKSIYTSMKKGEELEGLIKHLIINILKKIVLNIKILFKIRYNKIKFKLFLSKHRKEEKCLNK